MFQFLKKAWNKVTGQSPKAPDYSHFCPYKIESPEDARSATSVAPMQQSAQLYHFTVPAQKKITDIKDFLALTHGADAQGVSVENKNVYMAFKVKDGVNGLQDNVIHIKYEPSIPLQIRDFCQAARSKAYETVLSCNLGLDMNTDEIFTAVRNVQLYNIDQLMGSLRQARSLYGHLTAQKNAAHPQRP